MNLKSTIESVLKVYPPLYRLGSKVYHRMNPEFRTLSPGAPAAIDNALKMADTDPEAGAFSGDYYEFGLFRGGTFLAASQSLGAVGNTTARMYGFDSFQGLPEATSIDAGDPRFFEGQFACSRQEVEENLASNGMDMARATLIEGFYEDSLTEALRSQHDFKPASVVLLDCDYYTSTKVALDWMTPYLRVGTRMLFDDWFSHDDDQELGQQKALAEWLEAHPGFRVEYLEDFEANGRSFILRTAQ